MKMGILGFPNTGKTTVFNALTGQDVPTYGLGGPAGKTKLAVAKVRDERLAVLAKIYEPKKIVQATVDGVETPVVRGNVSLITVPVPEGAEMVELSFESADYRRGKAVSFLSLGLVILGLIVPSVMRKRASV